MARRTMRWLWAARGLLAAAPCVFAATRARAEPDAGPTPASGTAVEQPAEPAAQAATAPAPAADAPAAWTTRYEAARQHLVDGEYNPAYEEFVALAREAPTPEEKRLALEMAHVSAEGATRAAAQWRAANPVKPTEPMRRTPDEITLLYTTSFVYGVGTGAWFLLQTQPDSALTATLPFVAIAAAPIIGVAIVDGIHQLPHGVPHAISAGAYLGLGEGIWIVGFQHARSDRISASRDTSPRWDATVASSVLWGGATLGVVAGAALGTAIPTTPGRVSFTASTTLWGGALTGFTVSSLSRKGGHRSEDALLAAGLGYNVGLGSGLFLARQFSPSIARVRLVDMSGAAGGLVAGGLYLAFAGSDGNSRAGLGLAALGAATGLTIGWLATGGMAREYADAPAPAVTWNPTVIPVEKGAALGIAGFL